MWFNAKTVTHHLDVVDRQAASIVDFVTAEGSTVRFYNTCGFEFMTLKSARGSIRSSARNWSARGRAGGPDLQVRAPCNGGGRGVRPGRCGGEPNSAVRRARDGDPALFRGRSRLPALSMTRRGTQHWVPQNERRKEHDRS